jgi:hypothetical protein
MSALPDAAGTIYQPPKQSPRGQFVDAVIILALLMVVLFGVTYLVQSTSSSPAAEPKPIAQLPITATEKAQFQKLIDEGVVDLAAVNQQVADNTAKPGSEQYPIKLGALIATFGVIGIYLVFVYVMSFKEYREVIRERFGPPGSSPSSATNGEPLP